MNLTTLTAFWANNPNNPNGPCFRAIQPNYEPHFGPNNLNFDPVLGSYNPILTTENTQF
jgi:hypothetical protein